MKIEINKTYRHLLTPNQIWQVVKIENDRVLCIFTHTIDDLGAILPTFRRRRETFCKKLFVSIFKEFPLTSPSMWQKFINFLREKRRRKIVNNYNSMNMFKFEEWISSKGKTLAMINDRELWINKLNSKLLKDCEIVKL